jgi:hypothetical protein
LEGKHARHLQNCLKQLHLRLPRHSGCKMLQGAVAKQAPRGPCLLSNHPRFTICIIVSHSIISCPVSPLPPSLLTTSNHGLIPNNKNICQFSASKLNWSNVPTLGCCPHMSIAVSTWPSNNHISHGTAWLLSFQSHRVKSYQILMTASVEPRGTAAPTVAKKTYIAPAE